MTQPLRFRFSFRLPRGTPALRPLVGACGGVRCCGGRAVGALKSAGGEGSLVPLAARQVEHSGAVGWRGKLRVPEVEHEDDP